MSKIDVEFHKLCENILKNGKEYHNKKRDVKRLQIPSYTFRHEFKNGFSALSTKKIYWKGVVGELIWFLRGDNDVRFLNENGIKFWNKDAYNLYKKKGGELNFEEFEKIGVGSVGQNYSRQWRAYNGKTDQIQILVENMKSDIMSSQLIVNAWNPSEIHETALPPCHTGFQIVGIPLKNNKFGFELHWAQRSVDTFLGLPINIASYSLLAKILEKLTGHKALGVEGSLKCVHLYENQINATKEMLSRDPKQNKKCLVKLPKIYKLKRLEKTIFDLKIDGFELKNYNSFEEIKVEMLAPKNI